MPVALCCVGAIGLAVAVAGCTASHDGGPAKPAAARAPQLSVAASHQAVPAAGALSAGTPPVVGAPASQPPSPSLGPPASQPPSPSLGPPITLPPAATSTNTPARSGVVSCGAPRSQCPPG